MWKIPGGLLDPGISTHHAISEPYALFAGEELAQGAEREVWGLLEWIPGSMRGLPADLLTRRRPSLEGASDRLGVAVPLCGYGAAEERLRTSTVSRANKVVDRNFPCQYL